MIEKLVKTTGEWLKGEGPSSDVVVSSRIRLARNLAEQPFLLTASAGDRAEIYRSLAGETSNDVVIPDAMVVDIDEADEIDRNLLVERHLISRQHAAGEGPRGVTISPDETQAIMINEEDHLRIQSLRSGLQLELLWHEVNEIDEALANRVPFAFDEQLGYLTACPTNVGTGIRVSVMLHLPALRLTKEIERVARAARDLRLAVRGSYGEGTEAVGDLYQISNQTTLGKSEESIIETFSRTIIPKIVEYERAARETLMKQHSSQLDDKIWRSYGLLTNARMISSGETQSLLSPIRMGIHLDRFHAFDIRTLNEIFLYTQPAHLQKRLGKKLDDDERAAARADYLRERLASKPK
ncbi:MAG: protein arginine kinase [Planctomycetes bacterium]|nr:protein arginine kinase [Planctomycetota bacterium]MBI3836162.1 protein arginine kinase [Planctomycetota bacterium]